jgi:hypothetical protein
MSLRRTKKYDVIVDYLRARGMKVRHRPMVLTDGLYDPETEIITVASQLKGTILGCYVAYHEYGHHLQKKQKIFGKFMRGYGRYNKKDMDEVILAERHASTFSKRMLRGMGIKFNPPDLDDKNLPEFLEFWKKHYFLPEKRKKKGKV